MKIKPLNNTVIVKRVESNEVTHGGIILPLNVTEEKEIGKGDVIAKDKNIKDIKIGERILFKKYSPDIIKVDNENLQVVRYDDIIAILQNDDHRSITIDSDFEKDTLQPNDPKFKKAY